MSSALHKIETSAESAPYSAPLFRLIEYEKSNPPVKAFISKRQPLNDAQLEKLRLVDDLARSLMVRHGVSGMRFRFARYKWHSRIGGTCSGDSISLDTAYVLGNYSSTILNAILHEIAHALVGVRYGHREKWQNKARELGVTGLERYQERSR